ncbi:MAG: hypothetical protein H6549_06980 [Chitinophagales bacterium]|nr:hypothetical protein [Chitinophagales bacterium]
MIDNHFCEILEYRISESLSNSENIEMRRCWCDGIEIPDIEDDLSIVERNSILTQAWIDEGRIKGKSRGQFKYDIVIWLGEKSIKNYKNRLSIDECIPEGIDDSWISLNIKERKIEIQLY